MPSRVRLTRATEPCIAFSNGWVRAMTALLLEIDCFVHEGLDITIGMGVGIENMPYSARGGLKRSYWSQIT